jgi:hypothetical protein
MEDTMEEQLKEIVSLLEDIKLGIVIFISIFVGFASMFFKILHEKVDKKRK